MKKFIAFALAASAAMTVASTAEARQGCGPGFHRAYHGRCVVNRGRHAPRYVVGRYYTHHGWWDGRRFYRHRYRYHHGWRYR